MARMRCTPVAGVLGFVLGTGAVAHAQTIDPTPGGRVELVETSGVRTRGQLLELGREEVTLAVGREVRRYRWDALERVNRIERDSLLNGTLIGAGTGFAAGMITTGNICGTIRTDDECGAIGFAALTLPGAAIGAGVGALIDLAIPRKTVIVGGGSRPLRVALAPSVVPGTRGLRAIVQF